MKAKNILVRCITSVMAVLTILASGNLAFAADGNTADTDITSYTLSSTEKYTDCRSKNNDTPLYMYYTSGRQDAVRVSAYGAYSRSASSKYFYNETRYNSKSVSYVYVPINVKSSIRSLIYENGYGYAALGIRSLVNKTDTITGVWSPDSTKVYTVATTTEP